MMVVVVVLVVVVIVVVVALAVYDSVCWMQLYHVSVLLPCCRCQLAKHSGFMDDW